MISYSRITVRDRIRQPAVVRAFFYSTVLRPHLRSYADQHITSI